jgi:N-acetylglucosamine malate deacetylase 2
MKPHVLLVFPHPDDETFGLGGSIILHAKAGTPITYLCGTLGEMGRQMGSPITANRETLPHIRKRELQEACQHLGITDLRLLGYHDKTVEFEDRQALVDKIYQVALEVQATVVYTYYPGHAVHPDHEAMAEATVEALERIPLAQRPTLYALAFSHNHLQVLGPPDVVVDISSVVDDKLKAIKAHYTQTAKMLEKFKQDVSKQNTEMVRFLQAERYYTYRWT